MITADEIKMLVASGEGYNAEFKALVPAKVKELSEEVCAFANAAGGVLLIGINDQNKVVGVTVDNAKRSAIQNSLGEITPHLSCSILFVDVDGKNVGVIEVPSGPNKPYVLSGAIFVRIGPNTQKLTTAEQMRDFFQQSDKIYFDEMPCAEYNPDTMTDKDFLLMFKAESRISIGIPEEQIFRSLKLYSKENQFKNGAVLFFGKHPEEIVPAAILRCVAYQGIDKRFIIDDKPFAGNLYQQFQQAMNWLRSKLEIRYDIEGQGSAPRKEIWEIPETVFKEAILNALAHRDYYDKGAVILLELFDNRVELSNPGGLVSAIPESEFGKRSHSRNPLIFGLFARMHLVEQVGSGIVRMYDLMHEAKLPAPQFQKTGIFTVTLMRPVKSSGKSSEKGSEKSSEKIIKLIKENPAVTIAEMAESLGKSTRAVEKQLAKLKSRNIIDRTGSYKDGYWVIKNQETKGK
jgi:ATP-dependent DNA helicase RecG